MYFYKVFTTKSFQDIGVDDPIVLQNLERLNIFNPTKIQAASIPEMMEGKIYLYVCMYMYICVMCLILLRFKQLSPRN
jgi:hypothetical protein